MLVPVIGAILGKVWGTTQTLFCANNVEISRIRPRAGYRCSRHQHDGKYNLFYVIAGQIVVHTTKDGLDDQSVLGPGQYTYVKPGDKHHFEALVDSDVLEIYWVTLDPGDIQREDQGGSVGHSGVAVPLPPGGLVPPRAAGGQPLGM